MRHKGSEPSIIQVAECLYGTWNAHTLAKNSGESHMKMLLILLLASYAAAQDQPLAHIDANTPREKQIELAESAAPKEVSSKATIYVLTKNGYEKAREGSNGFTCLV